MVSFILCHIFYEVNLNIRQYLLRCSCRKWGEAVGVSSLFHNLQGVLWIPTWCRGRVSAMKRNTLKCCLQHQHFRSYDLQFQGEFGMKTSVLGPAHISASIVYEVLPSVPSHPTEITMKFTYHEVQKHAGKTTVLKGPSSKESPEPQKKTSYFPLILVG